MKKRICFVMTLMMLILTLLLSCSNSEVANISNDLYSGNYISIDSDTPGYLIISGTSDGYSIHIKLYNITTIDATGNVEHGTLYYHGFDQYGNNISGNIEEYGETEPVRVEFYSDGLFDEVEFKKQVQ